MIFNIIAFYCYTFLATSMDATAHYYIINHLDAAELKQKFSPA